MRVPSSALLLCFALVTLTGSASASGCDDASARHAPMVSWRAKVRFDPSGTRIWSEVPIASFSDDAVAEHVINADIEHELTGPGFIDAPALPPRESLEMGDALTTCATTLVDAQVLAFACHGVSMGAHPYDHTFGLAYDLRAGKTRRLAARDLFGDAGATRLAKLASDRARAQAIARGVDPGDVTPKIEPFELYAGHLEVTYDRCLFGDSCLSGAELVRISCADLSTSIGSDSPWKCQ